MKKSLLVLTALLAFGTAHAEGESKKVCHDEVKKGKTVQVCKTIKVHKKLDSTTAVPSK